MKRIKLLILALGLLTPVSLYAQDDTATWVFLSVKKALSPKWSLLMKSEIHTKDNTSDMDYYYILGGGGYKINSWLRTDCGILYVDYKNPGSEAYKSFWRPMYRSYVTFTFSKQIGPIRGSLREYWGYCWMPEATTEEGVYKKGSAFHEWRNRLRLDYSTGTKFTPYVYVEDWMRKTLERMRYVGGVDYKLDKHNTVGAFYMYQDKYKALNTHVLGIEYNLTL